MPATRGRLYTIPTPEYTLEGMCWGCLDERPAVYGDPDSHTCGYKQPADGLIIRVQRGEWPEDVNLQDLPF